MHRLWLSATAACVVATLAAPVEAQRWARAVPTVRAFSAAPTEPNLLAAKIWTHGMGGESAAYVWDDGRIEVRHSGSSSRTEHRKVDAPALDALRVAIARMRPARHRGYCEYGMLDGDDVEIQFRRGNEMIHLPCYIGHDSNTAVRALDALLTKPRSIPDGWWLHRPKLRVRAKNGGFVGFPDEGPSVTFRPYRSRRCKHFRPAQVVFSEREDGRIVVSMLGCLEYGPGPQAISVTHLAGNIVLRGAAAGHTVTRDRCMWRGEADLGRLDDLALVTIDLGKRWVFEVSWGETFPGRPTSSVSAPLR